jgi:isopentenyldiphosphate isomerase
MTETEPEILDLVDAEDRVIGAIDKEGYRGHIDGWIRTATVFLIQPCGLIWIPTRALHKTIFPGCLDASVSGHVQSGESYLQAALRETIEETGLQFSADELELLAVLHPVREGTFSFHAIFLARLGQQLPKVSAQDHHDACWMTLDELFDSLQKGVPARRDLPRMAQALQAFFKSPSSPSVRSSLLA